MARERTPLGKRVVIPVRVSEPMAEAVDKARGDTARSVWVEEAIAARLAVEAKPPSSRRPSVSATSPERLAELRAKAAAADVEPINDPAELARRSIEAHTQEIAAQAAPKPKNCKHPKVRVKGTCPDCFTYVGSKS